MPKLNLKKHDLRVCFEGEKLSEAVLDSFLKWNLPDVLNAHLHRKVIPDLEKSLGRPIVVRTQEELVALKAQLAPIEAQVDELKKEKAAKHAAQALNKRDLIS